MSLYIFCYYRLSIRCRPLQEFFGQSPCALEMDIWGKLALLYPISLVILIALQTTKARVLHAQPLSSLNTPRLIARTEQPVTLDPYTGTGAA